MTRPARSSPQRIQAGGEGPRLPFEAPFWAGEYPVVPTRGRPAYSLPFHPLDLGEAGLRDLLGFAIEGRVLDSDIDASAV